MVNVQDRNLDVRRIQRGAVHDRCRPGNIKGPTCMTGVDRESGGTHNRKT